MSPCNLYVLRLFCLKAGCLVSNPFQWKLSKLLIHRLDSFSYCVIIIGITIALKLFFVVQLETVNKNLEAYYDAWDKFIKAWIVIKINDPSCVYQWRLQVRYHINIIP